MEIGPVDRCDPFERKVPMRIGELAAQADVNVQTVRFYEREGLLPKPVRTASGYRSYQRGDTDRVKFIKVCQGLGFTLREVRQLMQLHGVAVPASNGAAISKRSTDQILLIAKERLLSIEEKITQLSEMRSEMQGVIQSLSGSDQPRCPASSTGPQFDAAIRSVQSGCSR